MRIAVLSPISWRTPPLHYGPWESVVSLLTEELVHMGLDVTLFATGDSQTSGKLVSPCPRPYSEDSSVHPKVAECLHISEVFERSADYDLIHNNFDFLPLTYSGLVDTPIIESTKYVRFDPEAILKAAPEKPMNPRRVARLILRGVDRNRFVIIMSVTAHALWRLHRYAPNTSMLLGKVGINKFRSLRREDD